MSIPLWKDDIQAFCDAVDVDSMEIEIPSILRKPIRELKTLFPQLFYFAYGRGEVYQLLLSKTKFDIDLMRLNVKTQNMIVDNIEMEIHPPEVLSKFDPFLDATSTYRKLQDCLLKEGGEVEFFNRHYDIQHRVEKTLTSHSKFSDFKEMDVVPVPFPKKVKIIKNLYSLQNEDKRYISIDLKSANFQVMRQCGLMDGCTTWEDFVCKMGIEDPYFSQSKKLRLKCLGSEKLLPKKQKRIWENMTIQLYSFLIEKNILSSIEQEQPIVYNSDEIVIEWPKTDGTDNTTLQSIEKWVDHFSKENGYHYIVDSFVLKVVDRQKRWFAKVSHSGSVKFKCVNRSDMVECIDTWTRLIQK